MRDDSRAEQNSAYERRRPRDPPRAGLVLLCFAWTLELEGSAEKLSRRLELSLRARLSLSPDARLEWGHASPRRRPADTRPALVRRLPREGSRDARRHRRPRRKPRRRACVAPHAGRGPGGVRFPRAVRGDTDRGCPRGVRTADLAVR